jgi:uncharacterized protein YecT (DUF1311 family)
MICKSKVLSELDYELGQSYRSLRNTLSKQDFVYLRDTQRSWLKHRERSCDDEKGKSYANCLMGVYRDRISYLSTFGKRSGAQETSNDSKNVSQDSSQWQDFY